MAAEFHPTIIPLGRGLEFVKIGAKAQRHQIAAPEISSQTNRVIVAVGKRVGKSGKLQIQKIPPQ